MSLTLLQLLVALFMSLGALCFLFWAVFSGMFDDVESVKYQTFRAEMDSGQHEEEPHERK